MYIILELTLFASRLNNQIFLYISWKPFSDAKSINAFFLLNGQIIKCLSSFQSSKQSIAEGEDNPGRVLMVVSLLPTQYWYPALIDLLIGTPLILPLGNLFLLHSMEKHPLHKNLTLIACRLSGKIWKCERFCEKFQILSWLLRDQVQNNNTQAIFENGFRSQINEKLVQFKFCGPSP